jgi:hypothetical protein
VIPLSFMFKTEYIENALVMGSYQIEKCSQVHLEGSEAFWRECPTRALAEVQMTCKRGQMKMADPIQQSFGTLCFMFKIITDEVQANLC